MPDRPKSPAAKRATGRQMNRMARVRAAADAQDDVMHLQAAYDFARASIKQLPPGHIRSSARKALAELIVNYALNELDAEDITRLEAVA